MPQCPCCGVGGGSPSAWPGRRKGPRAKRHGAIQPWGESGGPGEVGQGC